MHIGLKIVIIGIMLIDTAAAAFYAGMRYVEEKPSVSSVPAEVAGLRQNFYGVVRSRNGNYIDIAIHDGRVVTFQLTPETRIRVVNEDNVTFRNIKLGAEAGIIAEGSVAKIVTVVQNAGTSSPQ